MAEHTCSGAAPVTPVRPAPPIPLVVAFAAPPDPGVRESVEARTDARALVFPSLRGPALAEAAAAGDVLVVRSWQRVTADVLDAGAGRLRAVVQASAGLDNIDAAAAAARGIEVVGVDPGNATAVAELTLMSLIALLRDIRGHWARTTTAHWPDREVLADREARGKTLGLVGLGRVGTRVARRAAAFEMDVVAYDPYLPDDAFPARSARRAATLDDLLAAADALSLHCPLTEETRGMIGARELAALRPGSVVVNTARGEVLDLAALVRALDDGHLAGAAVDVWPAEPPPRGGPLLHPRILPTPHLAGHTAESHRERAANMIAALAALLGRLAPETCP